MFTPCGDIQSPLLHLPQCLLCSLQPPLPVETYKVHFYTYLSVCYVHSLWRYTKSTATLTSVFVMFTPATTPCGGIQSPLLHLPQCLLCSLPVETYKVHCYTYLSVCYVHSSHHSLWRSYKVHCYTYLSVCYVHSLWRHTKSTSTLTSVFVMFTPCGDIQSPLLHLPQCLLCSLPVETYKVHCYTYLSVCYVHSSHHSLWRHTKSTATLTSVFVMFTPATTPWGDIQSPLLHLPQCLLCSLPVEIYKVHCYTYLSVCYVHSLWRHTKSTATLTSVFVMFTPATTPCGDIQSPLLHLPQCLLCSLPVETYKVLCYTYLSVCYVDSSHHSLWRHAKSTATLTSVFVMFSPATTPCGDIQSPLLHLPQCLLHPLQPPLPAQRDPAEPSLMPSLENTISSHMKNECKTANTQLSESKNIVNPIELFVSFFKSFENVILTSCSGLNDKNVNTCIWKIKTPKLNYFIDKL